MTRICLNMIVKNESKIITRCLESVKDYIDYYVIEDTGSTDGTQKIITEYFTKNNIKGELHQNKWKSFGENRTHALRLAKDKADYILLIDADMKLFTKDKDFKNKLKDDMYSVDQDNGGCVYSNTRLIKGNLDYEYIGVTHEYLDCKKLGHIISKLDGVIMLDYSDGANRPDKYKRDIDLLNNELRNKFIPITLRQRYTFYLAQSYRDYKKFDKAIKYYKERSQLGGWPEEIYYSLYQIGMLYLMSDEYQNALDYMFQAYNMRPARSEPLYQLVKYYRIKGQPELAKLFIIKGLKTKYPKNDQIFIEKQIYDFLFHFEVVQIGYRTDDQEFGRSTAEALMHNNNIPDSIKQEVINMMVHYVQPLKKYCTSFTKKQYVTSKLKENYNLLNPSIVFYNDNYIINTREVNYQFDIQNNKYNYDGTIDTYNRLTYTKNLEADYFKSELVINNDSSVEIFPHHITGYEDFRLIIYKDQLYAICTCIKTNPKGINEMCLLRINDNKVDKIVRLKSDRLPEKTEKNWAPFVHNDKLLVMYSNQPTIILECDVESGLCKVVEHGMNSLDFSSYRGGSQIIPINDMYLYIIHQVGVINNRRYYYHRFVQMGKDLRIKRISPMFTFSDTPTIEFCSGICYDGNKLILTYGVEDCKCYIGTIDVKEVFDFIL